MNPEKKGSTMTNAKNSAKGDNVKNLLDEAEKLQTTDAEEATVPAQADRGEKVTAERSEDGKLHITVSDADEQDGGRMPNFMTKLVAKAKKNKKGLITGAVVAAAILLGVSVQKNRSTTEPAGDEPEATEPSEG